MQKPLTPAEIRLRLFLTVAVAGLGYLATNDTWIGLVGKVGVMLTGLVLVLFQAWRGFIDKSQADDQGGAPVEVEVANSEDNPVPVDATPTAVDHGA